MLGRLGTHCVHHSGSRHANEATSSAHFKTADDLEPLPHPGQFPAHSRGPSYAGDKAIVLGATEVPVWGRGGLARSWMPARCSALSPGLTGSRLGLLPCLGIDSRNSDRRPTSWWAAGEVLLRALGLGCGGPGRDGPGEPCPRGRGGGLLLLWHIHAG